MAGQKPCCLYVGPGWLELEGVGYSIGQERGRGGGRTDGPPPPLLVPLLLPLSSVQGWQFSSSSDSRFIGAKGEEDEEEAMVIPVRPRRRRRRGARPPRYLPELTLLLLLLPCIGWISYSSRQKSAGGDSLKGWEEGIKKEGDWSMQRGRGGLFLCLPTQWPWMEGRDWPLSQRRMEEEEEEDPSFIISARGVGGGNEKGGGKRPRSGGGEKKDVLRDKEICARREQ